VLRSASKPEFTARGRHLAVKKLIILYSTILYAIATKFEPDAAHM